MRNKFYLVQNKATGKYIGRKSCRVNECEAQKFSDWSVAKATAQQMEKAFDKEPWQVVEVWQ